MFYYVNGFLLWLAYVVFRVVSPLFSVHYMYVEMRDRKDVAWVSEDRSYNGKTLGGPLGLLHVLLRSTWLVRCLVAQRHLGSNHTQVHAPTQRLRQL